MNTGFFGKIPATGDFVAANLPRIFIDRWDRWMSMELLARPDEGELDSRAWRFIIQAGIFGDPSKVHYANYAGKYVKTLPAK